jgi:hypothetical protein
MVVAALMADGTSEIEEIGHIERGYENIVEKLRGLGADISKVERMPIPSSIGTNWGNAICNNANTKRRTKPWISH